MAYQRGRWVGGGSGQCTRQLKGGGVDGGEGGGGGHGAAEGRGWMGGGLGEVIGQLKGGGGWGGGWGRSDPTPPGRPSHLAMVQDTGRMTSACSTGACYQIHNTAMTLSCQFKNCEEIYQLL